MRFALLLLLPLLGACTTLPPKSEPVALPSTLPVRKAVAAVKESTAKAKQESEDTRDAIDRAIVEAHNEALARTDAERTQAQAAFQAALQQAKAKAADSADSATAADQRADDAIKEAAALKASQDEAASKALAQQEENEAMRAQLVASKRWWGLGGVWIGLRSFFLHAMLWIAGLGVIAGALSFFFPPVAAFFSVVLSNIINLFRKR